MDLLVERRADRYRRSRRQSSARHNAPRPPWQWRPGGAWALGVVLATGLVVGGLVGWSLAAVGHRDRSAAAAARTGAAGLGPSCRSVLAKADDSLALAMRFQHALRDHVRVMERLAQHTITPGQALALDHQPLATGSADAARFDAALADYLAAVDDCRIN
jgi:hypothetical protein